MRISNYPTDTLSGEELILATDVDTSTQKYKTVNFSVDTLKTFLVGTDDTNEFTNITLGGSLKFEGATANASETTLSAADPTQDRAVTIPNAHGYVALFAADPGSDVAATITATPAELGKLDGFTGDHLDLNYAKDLRATGVTTTEFDILDGLTSSTAELNKLDGVTASTAEINYLAGSGSTAATNKVLIPDGTNSININGGDITNIQKVDANIINVSDDSNTLQSGAISLTDTVSPLSTGGSNGATTLAAATGGLVKILVFAADGGGDMVTTVTNAGWKSSGSGTITFDTIGDACTLVYAGSKWYVSGNNGCTFA
tara:strand:- start:940 stop:1887 length:948 start_codon:yes stop_codon:yes gene_type:complete